MLISRNYLRLPYLIKTLLICSFVFFSTPSYAGYYGGHHYRHGYGHYPHYRHHYGYGHHYRYHRGYRSHYGVHGHFSGNAAYVVLGILGAAVLTHIITKNSYDNKQYRRTHSYNQTRTYIPPAKTKQTIGYKKTTKKPVYNYKRNEGWGWLAKGNANYALDIFAIQSQQNLNSGIPKIGFSIAAAINGETERAARTMRRAIRIDAVSLDNIDVTPISKTIESLSKNYNLLNINKTDKSFMLATLSYLKKDYDKANELMRNTDQSQSAKNLRRLLEKLN